MAEKLSASAWNAFAKKKELDDGNLVKAFTKFEAVDENKHDARLDALDELVNQLNKLVVALPKKKPPLPDKEQREVKDKLHGLIDTAERLQKDVRDQKSKAEAQAEEEEDTPVLLTTKMVPLIRDVRKGEIQMPVMLAIGGKACAVLIMRRSIAPTRRKLLAEYLQLSSGLKYANGHCLLEDGVLTFVMQTAAAGLAKRLRQALMDQTGLRLKVRVRGEDGDDVDGQDEAEDGNVATNVPPAPPAPPAPPGSGESPEAQRWQQRWPEVSTVVNRILQQGGHPAEAKLRAVLGFAADKGEKAKDYAAGLKALDTLVQLLRPAAAAPAGAPAAPAAAGTGPKVAPAIVYTQSRLAWVATRGKIKVELDKLEQAILAHYKDSAALPEVVRSVRKLDAILQTFDEGLADRLDSALNATDAAEKGRWHGEARDLITQYQGFLATDALVQDVDANPFVPVAVRSTLDATLKTLAAKMV